jgi:hypothetical protein
MNVGLPGVQCQWWAQSDNVTVTVNHPTVTMPRRPTTGPKPESESGPLFPCLVADCLRKFRTISGRTRHFNAIHDHDEPRRENFPHIPPKRPRATVNPLSHDEPNLPDIRMSNPPHLDEADPGFQDRDYTPLPIFDFDNVPQASPLMASPTLMPSPTPSSPDSETDENSVPAIEYHPYIDGV